MKHQAIRNIALMLSVLLATAAPAQADTLHFANVIQAAAEGRRGSWADLRLRALQQQGGKTAAGVVASTQGKTNTSSASSGNTASAPDGSNGGNTTTSLISHDPAQQQGTVETIDLGDVTGTVCDCGEIPEIGIPGGGFPLWPLAGLAAIPLAFIERDDNPPTIITPSPPEPTPTSTPAPIPEPATLLLFGSGLLALGAGARRRRRLKASEVEAHCQEVV